jgi:FKBP12-rapamycin complex-associated protein
MVDSGTRQEVLQLFVRATTVDPRSYQAWHEWGLSNYRAIEEIKATLPPSSGAGRRTSFNIYTQAQLPNQQPLSPPNRQQQLDQINNYVSHAVKGLLRALSLGTRRWSSSVAQDMLCILSLWFRYAGKLPAVYALLEGGLLGTVTGNDTVHLDNWLGVLPQLIARIDHPDKRVRKLLHSLLIQLGSRHAQALVFPLSVALNVSNNSLRLQ